MTTTRTDFVKSAVEQAMLERILFIGDVGEDLPSLRDDVAKHVFMGTPAELIAAIEAPINARIEAIKEDYEDQLRLTNEALDEGDAFVREQTAEYQEALNLLKNVRALRDAAVRPPHTWAGTPLAPGTVTVDELTAALGEAPSGSASTTVLPPDEFNRVLDEIDQEPRIIESLASVYDKDVHDALLRAEAAILAESYSLPRARQEDMRAAAAIVRGIREHGETS